jgi:hypothetical protein
LRIRRPIGVENRRRIYRFVEDSRRRWGVEDAALSPRDFFNGLLARDRRWKLYDLDNDPLELSPVDVEKPEIAATKKRLKQVFRSVKRRR